MRLFLLLLIIAGLVVTGAYYYGRVEQKQSPEKGTAAVSVVTAPVQQKRISDVVEALGTLQANESIDITATAAETIARIEFIDGQHVAQGAVIAVLEQGEEQAELAAAKAQLADHERELKRLQNLMKNKAAAQREVDERSTERDITAQQIAAISARIDDRTLTAPFSGRLGIRRKSEGALVQPGDVITTLDDLSQVKLDFSVPSVYLSSLKPGLSVRAASQELQGETFEGVIATIDTRIDPVTRAVMVRAILPNPDERLKPGMLMQVRLLSAPRDSLIVPEEAVLQRQQDHFVMVVAPDATVEERRIEAGIRESGWLEVRKGLKAGERIVTRGIMKVKSGQKVNQDVAF